MREGEKEGKGENEGAGKQIGRGSSRVIMVSSFLER